MLGILFPGGLACRRESPSHACASELLLAKSSTVVSIKRRKELADIMLAYDDKPTDLTAREEAVWQKMRRTWLRRRVWNGEKDPTPTVLSDEEQAMWDRRVRGWMANRESASLGESRWWRRQGLDFGPPDPHWELVYGSFINLPLEFVLAGILLVLYLVYRLYTS